MPQFSDEIVLVGASGYTVNAIGDPIPVPAERPILANRKSVRQSEFYQAQSAGLKPEIMFDVWEFEYQGETRLRYLGRVYDIIRTHQKDGEMLELVCTGLVNANATT